MKGEVKSGAMIGQTPQNKNLAFFLPDQGNALYLGINTPIRGEIYAPISGIRPTGIGQGNKKIKHDYLLKKSALSLPRITSSLIKQLDTLLNPSLWYRSGQSTIPVKSINSFFTPTLTIDLNVPTTLDEIRLIGNIWIRSTAPITIGASCKLIDVVISAPIISFEEGFSGQVQAIASERIEVASACHFPIQVHSGYTKKHKTRQPPLDKLL